MKNTSTDLQLQKNVHTAWVGPRGVHVPSVQDLIDALMKVEDKSLPICVTDFQSNLGGSIDEVIFHDVQDSDKACDEGGFLKSQVEIKVSNIWI